MADLNGDTSLDLVIVNDGSGVSVLLGRGDGTFETARSYLLTEFVDRVLDCSVNWIPVKSTAGGSLQSQLGISKIWPS